MAYIFPKKIFPSTLSKYLKCPFQFKCHNDRDVKPAFVENPLSFMGKAMHLVLKDLFDITKVSADKRKEQDLSQMVRYTWARIPKSSFTKEYWSDKERNQLFGSKEQEKSFGLQTIAMLKNYVASMDSSVTPLFLEDWMDCQAGEFTISGQIDRIDQDSESLISVWDYKTGKLPYHDSVEKMMEEDLQIPIYAVIASKRNPFAKKIRAGLIYIKYSKVYDIVWTREQLVEIENMIIVTIKKARDDNQLLPRINKLCPWCDYIAVCPEKDKVEERNKRVDEVSW